MNSCREHGNITKVTRPSSQSTILKTIRAGIGRVWVWDYSIVWFTTTSQTIDTILSKYNVYGHHSAWHSSATVYFVLMFRVATDVCSDGLNVLFDHLQSFKDTAMSVDPRKWTLIISLLSLNVTRGKGLFPLFAHTLNYLQSNMYSKGDNILVVAYV